MIEMKRSRRDAPEDTVSNYIETISYYIDSDGESLWRIVPGGRTFGFDGDELAEFVRLCVLRLLEAGAVAVRHADEGPLNWVEQTQYGSSNEEVADAIVAEWLEAGGGDPEWHWLWFVTRGVLETDRREPADIPNRAE
ncbi:MAG: hypothetical protein K2Y42_02500 [Hyphomicrobium sp.]|jgi:hypothetical protein|uniref:hypothetical protein n=1 Tax=Hyphomicrobium sp. TaxID=82 RepID=UPI0025C4E6D3|nr:hypothetical protein [Hyphomicrobium sp.]MBX9861600.1 hypothetical protein [Hyphomicrobium sp.]